VTSEVVVAIVVVELSFVAVVFAHCEIALLAVSFLGLFSIAMAPVLPLRGADE
jgi:hypothetical protein